MSQDPEKQISRHLHAILDAASDLLFEVGVPATAEELADGDRTRQLAFCECVRRIGEAVARIDDINDTWLSIEFPGIPWSSVKATRNRLTHNYWTIDYVILHDSVVHDLPLLTAPVAAHLQTTDPYRRLDPARTIVQWNLEPRVLDFR